MAATTPQTISGKTKTVSPLSAASDRYTFLNLQNAEPNTGAPVGGNADSTFLFSSDTAGTRYWTTSATISLSGDRMGLGVTTPNEKLTVVGNISATGTIYGLIPGLSGGLVAAGGESQVQFNSGGFLAGRPSFTFSAANSSITVGSSNTNNLPNTFILGSGITATFANYTYLNNLSVLGSALANTGTFNSLYVQSGRAGIGTLTPNEKLTVVGNISATGTIFADLSAVAINAVGKDTQVQFNSGGKFSADAGFLYNYSLSSLQVGHTQRTLSGALFTGILGGQCNYVSCSYSGVTFGRGNSALNSCVTIGGGASNNAYGLASTIGGGNLNVAANVNAYIGGGACNQVLGSHSTVAGGRNNIAASDYAIIGGGFSNCTNDTYAVVGGGTLNIAAGYASNIGGGSNNCTVGIYATIAGGNLNYATGACAGILGGSNNCATHTDSFVIGSNIRSSAACTTFVNNLSTAGNVSAATLSLSALTITSAVITSLGTATDAFVTVMVGGSALALPLFRLP